MHQTTTTKNDSTTTDKMNNESQPENGKSTYHVSDSTRFVKDWARTRGIRR